MVIRVVVDTNIYFSALYSKTGNEAEIVRQAHQGMVTFFSPHIVQGELKRVLQEKLGFHKEETATIISSLPTQWVPNEVYKAEIPQARDFVPHKSDAPIFACALHLDIGILTGNTTHFKLPRIEEKVKIWSSQELLQALNRNENSQSRNHELFP